MNTFNVNTNSGKHTCYYTSHNGVVTVTKVTDAYGRTQAHMINNSDVKARALDLEIKGIM